MSFTDDSSDPEWRNTKIKREQNINGEHNSPQNSKPKYSQKFCDKWLTIFKPWLARCEDDFNKPFCKACQCRLDCNKCHLQRHERTTKHARNLEILISKGEGAARQNLSIRQERSKYYQQRRHLNSSAVSSQEDSMEMDTAVDYIEVPASFQYVQTENTPAKGDAILKSESDHSVGGIKQHQKTIVKTNSSNRDTKITAIKKDRIKLLKQIQKDKTELMDSFKELMGNASYMPQSLPKEKNHVDLFFDSVISTVKSLSPKLISEAKMRVSQLICELELRALTDEESSATGFSRSAPVVVSAVAGSNTYITNQQRESHDEDIENYASQT